jgi:hypothetical protein
MMILLTDLRIFFNLIQPILKKQESGFFPKSFEIVTNLQIKQYINDSIAS